MLWIDGAPVGAAQPLDRGLEFGDGLFETLAVVDGRPRLLERHLERLARGATVLGLCLPPAATLRAELVAAAAVPGTVVLKLLVSRGDGGIGYAVAAERPVRRYVVASPARRAPLPAQASVTRLATPLVAQGRLAGLKHLNRLEQVLLRRDVTEAGADEGLVSDEAGRLIGGVMTNVFLVRHGAVVTPDLCRCGIDGVMRAAVLAALRDAGIPVTVRDVAPSEVDAAEEVFLTNALVGVWPVGRIGATTFPIGPLTRALQAQVAAW